MKVVGNLVKAAERKDARPLAKAWGYAKPAVSLGLDGVSTLFPFLKAPREVLRAVAGFDERQVTDSTPGMAGGSVVRTMNAPVSFARNQVQTGWKTLGTSSDGGEVWSFTDMRVINVGPPVSYVVTTASTTPDFNIAVTGISPVNPLLFPNFYQTALIWERWRPLKIIQHYCHFAPTDVQAAVAHAVTDDVSTTLPSDLSAFMALEHSTQGSCYEDFSLATVPAPWKAGTWLFMDTTAAANSAGYRQSYAGSALVATDANSAASAPLGYIYVELLFEVSGKRQPLAGISTLTAFDVAVSLLPPEERESFFKFACSRLWKDVAKIVEQRNWQPLPEEQAFVVYPPLLKAYLSSKPQALQSTRQTGVPTSALTPLQQQGTTRLTRA